MPGDHVVHGWCVAAVADVGHVEAGAFGEKRHGEMCDAAGGAFGIGHLVLLRFYIGYELRQRLGWEVLVNCQHEAVDRDRADRCEIPDRIVVEFGHRGRDRHRRRYRPEQRVAVGRRPRNRIRGQRPIGTDAIFHDERLAEGFREALRDDTCHHVRIAASGIGNDDPHRP